MITAPGRSAGSSPPAKPKLTERIHALPKQPQRRVRRARGRATAGEDRIAEPGGDPCLRRQPDDEPRHRPGGQNPTSTRRVLPRRRLR